MLFSYFCGLLMGAADLVPGVSGGTVAFTLGIYEKLIDNIHAFNKRLFREVHLSFLVFLLLGIATSLLTLAKGVHFLLGREEMRKMFYLVFFVLIAISVFFCVKKVKKWNIGEYLCLFLGISLAFIFTTLPTANIDNPSALWLICSGTAAVCAMLLPGVSGSYMLHLFGVYPLAIKALAHLSRESFFILGNLLVGIVLGVVLFSRVLHWALKKHHDLTLALLIGFMVGGMRTFFI